MLEMTMIIMVTAYSKFNQIPVCHNFFFKPTTPNVFLPQKHIFEALFLRFWDFTVFIATASPSSP